MTEIRKYRTRAGVPAALVLALLGWLVAPPASLQAQGPKLLISDPSPLTIKRGSTADVKLAVTLNEGFHANSHTPSDENLIPLKLTWEPGAVSVKDVIYPKPKMEKYAFSDKPLSVVSGAFDLTTKFAAAANASPGNSTITGKLRYQACNSNSCFPPKTVEVKVPVSIQ
jgi:thiol:disulfide interchange protein DsbD